MAKPTEKATELAALEIYDRSKPIVRPFYDKEAEIAKFIELRIPHVPYSTAKINRVYQSKDGRVYRFRINYYGDHSSPDCFVTVKQMVASKYVQINVNLDDNKFEMVDLTAN